MNPSVLRRAGGALTLLSFVTSVSFFLVETAGAAEPDPADPAKVEAPGEQPKPLRHGSRAKAGDGTMLVYDNVYGVFMVPGREHTYWIKDRFYQYEHGVWLAAGAVAGPWELVSPHVVPDAAVERYGPLKKAVRAKLPWGVEAVYDPRLKSYKVAGRKGVFLFENLFYRYDNGVWFESRREDGPWIPASVKRLPVTLKKSMPAPESGQTVTLPSGGTVVFDAGANMFRVQGKPDTVLFDGKFYERREDKWFSSPKPEATFEEVAVNTVPVPVRALFKKPSDAAKKPPKEPREKKQKADKGRAKGTAKKDGGRTGAATKNKKQKNTGEKASAGEPQKNGNSGQPGSATGGGATSGDKAQ